MPKCPRPVYSYIPIRLYTKNKTTVLCALHNSIIVGRCVINTLIIIVLTCDYSYSFLYYNYV